MVQRHRFFFQSIYSSGRMSSIHEQNQIKINVISLCIPLNFPLINIFGGYYAFHFISDRLCHEDIHQH